MPTLCGGIETQILQGGSLIYDCRTAAYRGVVTEMILDTMVIFLELDCPQLKCMKKYYPTSMQSNSNEKQKVATFQNLKKKKKKKPILFFMQQVMCVKSSQA
ncbi:hypothetical protein HanIR_Chr11g0528701 [Helianthus annuus]|nr:hypothetical protein HanIR_Chr11g0528701 [Helianthus annuus]